MTTELHYYTSGDTYFVICFVWLKMSENIRHRDQVMGKRSACCYHGTGKYKI